MPRLHNLLIVVTLVLTTILGRAQPVDSTFSKNVALLGAWQRSDFRFPEELRSWSQGGNKYVIMTNGNYCKYAWPTLN